jgi:hypothetical protein
LVIEKNHLESSLKENIELKDQYRQKNEQLSEKYEILFKESEFLRREIVAIDELKHDRDTRINSLR